MSLVYCFATKNSALIVGDHRRTILETMEYFDDRPKAWKVNENLLFGCCGKRTPEAESIINGFKSNKDLTIERAVNMFYGWLNANRHLFLDYDFGMFFAGKTKSGKMAISAVHASDNDVYYEEFENEIIWNGSIAKYNPEEWLENRLKSVNSITEVKKAAADLVEHVSKRDKFVSPGYDIYMIGGE